MYFVVFIVGKMEGVQQKQQFMPCYRVVGEKEQLMTKNQKMFNKLIDITIADGPYGQGKVLLAPRKSLGAISADKSVESVRESNDVQRQSRFSTSSKFRSTSLHHNYQVDNIRKSRLIDEENPKLAQRIMEKTGDLSHHKDLQQFRKTRQIVHRLQKFQQLKRAIQNSQSRQQNNSEGKIRSKTLPAQQIKTKLQKLQTQIPQDHKLKEYDIDQEPRKPSSKSKSFRSRIKEGQRYRTIETIREQQVQNNVSEEFGGLDENKNNKEKKEINEEGDEDHLLNRYLDAERAATK